MKILHSSDWHLGHNLMNKDRKYEHEKFLSWLHKTIVERDIDLLLVSGDIFDTGTPPSYALSLYYKFLSSLIGTSCKKVIITGGNHDSISTLNSPKDVLKFINVHVIGGITDNLEDEIVEVKNSGGNVELIVCAVPYLRERDVRKSIIGGNTEERKAALGNGIKKHYEKIEEIALELRKNRYKNENIPIVVTGHLFVTGGKISEGEKNIFVGNLDNLNSSIFSENFSYVALGHLHRAQLVDKKENIRYSGSPIPLSFSEVGSQKEVVLIDFNGKMKIKTIEIPKFRELITIEGTPEEIREELEKLEKKERNEKIWVEIQIKTDMWTPDFYRKFITKNVGENYEIIKIRRLTSALPYATGNENNIERLESFTVENIFKKLLESKNIEENLERELLENFQEICATVDLEEKS